MQNVFHLLRKIQIENNVRFFNETGVNNDILIKFLQLFVQYFAHKSKNLEKIIATEKTHVSQRKLRFCEP